MPTGHESHPEFVPTPSLYVPVPHTEQSVACDEQKDEQLPLPPTEAATAVVQLPLGMNMPGLEHAAVQVREEPVSE